MSSSTNFWTHSEWQFSTQKEQSLSRMGNKQSKVAKQFSHDPLTLLLDRFIRIESNNIPKSVSIMIGEYLSNIIPRFEIMPEDIDKEHIKIDNYGLIFKRDAMKKVAGMINPNFMVTARFPIASSVGWNEGVHVITLSLIKVGNDKDDDYSGDVFGITDNIESCTKTTFWFTSTNAGTQYLLYDKAIIGDSKQENVAKSFEDGDVIDIKLDCNQWNVEFYVNGKQKGNQVVIEPNKTYYPFIISKYNNVEYHFLGRTN